LLSSLPQRLGQCWGSEVQACLRARFEQLTASETIAADDDKPDPTELDERRLRMELMRGDIENKQADTRYKRRLADWEPWKAMAIAQAPVPHSRSRSSRSLPRYSAGWNDLTIIERKLQEIRDENRKFAARLIAAALTAAAIGGLSGYKLGSMPPQQIIIQQPAAKWSKRRISVANIPSPAKWRRHEQGQRGQALRGRARLRGPSPTAISRHQVQLTLSGWEQLGHAAAALRERYDRGYGTVFEHCLPITPIS
jgi:hypothetical protein